MFEDSLDTQMQMHYRDPEMRQLNAFSANDDFRAIFNHESVQNNDQVLKSLRISTFNNNRISSNI